MVKVMLVSWLCYIVGDHLPEDKLAAFLAKCKAVVSEQGTATKEGAAAAQALNDYSANTLGVLPCLCCHVHGSRGGLPRNVLADLHAVSVMFLRTGADNVGFQMLKGLGWTQGYATA